MKRQPAVYWTDWMITTPTVNAIMTPTIITLEACWVRRMIEVTVEIPNIMAMIAAGAIKCGISSVNQMSVSIFSLVTIYCHAPVVL